MASPTELLTKLKQHQIAKQAAIAHQTLGRQNLVPKSDQVRLSNDYARSRQQLIQMVGDNPLAQALLQYILDS